MTRALLSIFLLSLEAHYGFILSFSHVSNNNILFIVLYLHSFKARLYTKSIINTSRNSSIVSSAAHHSSTLLVGIIISLCTRFIAFTGYSIAFGNRSYWGITVIRAISIPLDNVYAFRLSGFIICLATLTKFYNLHVLLPLVRLVVIILHIILLHSLSSSIASFNVLLCCPSDFIEFGLYFAVKDLVGLVIYFIILHIVVNSNNRYVSHPDNSWIINSVGTPSHISPEYYFLAAYSILKSIPEKETGFVVFGVVVFSSIGLCTGDEVYSIINSLNLLCIGALLPTRSLNTHSGEFTHAF